jgi:hypothetical protein
MRLDWCVFPITASLTTNNQQSINWALEHNVDIISVDFPFTYVDEENEGLKKAIERAYDKETIMLCSANKVESGRFPGYVRYHYIIIGTLRESGSELDQRFCDFFLPGENIPLRDSNGQVQSSESGNHVAMAIGSGLAGLLIFCSNRVAQERTHPITPRAMRRLLHRFTGELDKTVRVDHMFRGESLQSEEDLFNLMEYILRDIESQ